VRYKLSEPFPAFNSGQSAILRLGVCKFSPGGRLPNRTHTNGLNDHDFMAPA
jgi:hypothetical protein